MDDPLTTPSGLRADGCWAELLRPVAAGPLRPALFLDRDGVVVAERHHLRRPEDVALLPGAAGLIVAANRAGWPVVLITNQSGIARGLFDWAAFTAVQNALTGQLAARGATLDMVLACPFHPSHPWRKPAPGMLLEAARHLPLDLARSWIVGDKADDLAAGRAAGLRQGAHVMTGHGPAERRAATRLAGSGFAVHLWSSLLEAELPFASTPGPDRGDDVTDMRPASGPFSEKGD